MRPSRKKDKLRKQYQELAGKPLWRLFKVVYAIVAGWLTLEALSKAYDAECSDQLYETRLARGYTPFGHSASGPDIPCSAGPAVLAGLLGALLAVIAFIVLFLVIRRLVAYIVFGSMRKTDDERIMS